MLCFNTSMNTNTRRYEISKQLKEQKTVEVNELSQKYKVSKMTIRRDLDILEKEGIATKTYGGAIINESMSKEPSFVLKEGMSLEDKKEVAKIASHYIQDGDSIYIDCGTTCLELAKRVLHKKITMFTNFWKILEYVDIHTKAKIILAPGTYDPVTQAALSEITIEFFKNYTIDKCFIAALGIDQDFGASVPNMRDAAIKKYIMSCSKQKYLVIDASKQNQIYMSKIADIQDFDQIITNKKS